MKAQTAMLNLDHTLFMKDYEEGKYKLNVQSKVESNVDQ